MNPLGRRTVLILLAGLLVTGCGADPDAQSGGDAYRNEAAVMKVGEEWTTDDVSLEEGDATDWKAVDVAGTGKLVIELGVDEASAELTITAFGRYGDVLGSTFHRAGSEASRLEVDAARPGRYFIMVRASGGPATTYMVRATLAEPEGGSPGDPSGRPGF